MKAKPTYPFRAFILMLFLLLSQAVKAEYSIECVQVISSDSVSITLDIPFDGDLFFSNDLNGPYSEIIAPAEANGGLTLLSRCTRFPRSNAAPRGFAPDRGHLQRRGNRLCACTKADRRGTQRDPQDGRQ